MNQQDRQEQPRYDRPELHDAIADALRGTRWEAETEALRPHRD